MGVTGCDTHGQPADRRQCFVVMVERKGRKVGTLRQRRDGRHVGVMGGDTHIQCCEGGRHKCDWRRHSPTVLGRKEVRCGDDGTQRTEGMWGSWEVTLTHSVVKAEGMSVIGGVRHSPTVLGQKAMLCGHGGTQRTEGRHRQRWDGRHGCDGR